MLSVEDRIRRYEPFFGEWYLGNKIEKLGEGTSGSVFTVHNGQLDAAVKVIGIPRDQGDIDELYKKHKSEENVRRELEDRLNNAKTEIEIMNKLNRDSHIVCFEQDCIVERTDTYGWDVLIRMEKLMLVTDMLEDEGFRRRFDKRFILRIWLELLEGLRCCASEQIVHLDIKPENIFYAPGRDHFKLGDFGVSAQSVNGQKVMEGICAGTPDYMAPEVYRADGGDVRSDIYSLALTVYRWLNDNRLPFTPANGVITNEDFSQALKTRLSGKHPIPEIPKLDRPVMDVLSRCLEFEPQNRYQMVEDVIMDLSHAMYGGGSSSRSKTVPLMIAGASLSLAVVMIMLGTNLTQSKNSNNNLLPEATQASLPVSTELSTASELVSRKNEYQAELSGNSIAIRIPDEESRPVSATAEAVNDSIVVDGNMNFAGADNRALAYISARIEGNVLVSATANGTPVQVYRICDNSVQPPQSVSNWPADGYCFYIPDNSSDDTIEISMNCTDASGEVLYSYNENGYWLTTGSKARIFRLGKAPVQLTPLTIQESSFTIENGFACSTEAEYTYFGNGHAGAEVLVLLNGANAGKTTVDRYGQWQFSFGREMLEAAGECTVSFSYEDGKSVDAEPFIFDGFIAVPELLDELCVDSDKLNGWSEAGASITLWMEDTCLGIANADEMGYFSMSFDPSLKSKGVTQGCTLTLLSSDHVGNQNFTSIVVGARSSFAPISVNTPAEVVRTDLPVQISGSAQANEVVEFSWDGSEDIACVLSADADGQLRGEVDLPTEADGEMKLFARYAERPDISASLSIRCDGSCSITAEGEFSEDAAILELSCEPGARGSAMLNGVVVEEFDFDQHGCYDLYLSDREIQAGDVLKIIASDAVANHATLERVAEAGVVIPIEAWVSPSPDADGSMLLISGESVELQLIMSGKSSQEMCIRVLNNGVLIQERECAFNPDGDYETIIELDEDVKGEIEIEAGYKGSAATTVYSFEIDRFAAPISIDELPATVSTYKPLKIKGQAEPEKTLVLTAPNGDSYYSSVSMEGEFEFAVDLPEGSNDKITLEIRYADIETDVLRIPLQLDSSCELTVLSEIDTNSTELRFFTEGNTIVSLLHYDALWHDSTNLFAEFIELTGEYVIYLNDVNLQPGNILKLEAVDFAGNRTVEELIVSAAATAEPTATPAPTFTPEPTSTPKPTATPKPTDTPKPRATSKPIPVFTPEPTQIIMPRIVHDSLSNGLEYMIIEDACVITAYTGDSAELVIPDIIEGRRVTAIGDKAFCSCPSLQNVTVPAGVREIGENAFSGSTGMVLIVEPDSYAQQYAQENAIAYELFGEHAADPLPAPEQDAITQTGLDSVRRQDGRVIIPAGESYEVLADVKMNGTACATSEDEVEDTLRMTISVESLMEADYYQAKYATTYLLKGNETAVCFQIEFDGEGRYDLEDILVTGGSCVNGRYVEGYLPMDKEIGGNYEISIADGDILTLYKRYAAENAEEALKYFIVNAWHGGEETEYWFELPAPVHVDAAPVEEAVQQNKKERSSSSIGEIIIPYGESTIITAQVREDGGMCSSTDEVFATAQLRVRVEMAMDSDYCGLYYGNDKLAGVGFRITNLSPDVDGLNQKSIGTTLATADKQIQMGNMLMDAPVNGSKDIHITDDGSTVVYKTYDSKQDVSYLIISSYNDGERQSYWFEIPEATQSAAAYDPSFKGTIGSRGDDIQKLQQALIDQGFLEGSADGIFGKMTASAVTAAQAHFGLPQTGVADIWLLNRLGV